MFQFSFSKRFENYFNLAAFPVLLAITIFLLFIGVLNKLYERPYKLIVIVILCVIIGYVHKYLTEPIKLYLSEWDADQFRAGPVRFVLGALFTEWELVTMEMPTEIEWDFEYLSELNKQIKAAAHQAANIIKDGALRILFRQLVAGLQLTENILPEAGNFSEGVATDDLYLMWPNS